MIQLKIQGEEFRIKSSWEEISFREFINILYINNDNSYNNISKLIKTIVEITDRKDVERYLFGLSIEDFGKLKSAFEWLSVDVNSIKGKSKDFFTVDGQKYKIKSDYSKLSVGEMISLETFLKDRNIDAHPFEIAFAILFRKLDENGNETEFNEKDFLEILTNLLDKVMTVEVIEHVNFFLLGDKDSITKSSKDFSIQTVPMNLLECQKKKLKNTKKKKNKA